MNYHHQNLTDGELPLWRHGRAWLGPLAWEWGFFRRASSLGVSLGSRSFSIRVPWLISLYVHARDDDAFSRREFEIRVNDDCVWISHPWVRQMEWRSDDPWWRKDIVLHVVDWLIGKARYEDVKGQPFRVVVPMPEGCYYAQATPSTSTWTRRWYWPKKTRKSVSLHIPGGIGHSGKGENSWDCGDDGLWGCGGDDVYAAIARAVESVLHSRRRYGFDSKDTGREPTTVLNADRYEAEFGPEAV